ncbi:LOW QUALITY PROTEIN: hypothetical protein Cgig2_005216 [Carnegiea gigantea]|uniref:Uncharacterized protein n=1 Tax=Carnegiea gigantea TaxID=171969 RepID=A0A9Q1JVG9_9CARY|nr:LOW QUALITY PROTEIN: hypothetical protein Cgig2_005216 [Carnegiea gigantea]
MDALKSFMTTTTDTFGRQVWEQVDGGSELGQAALPTLITYPPMVASHPTGRIGYHPLVIQSGKGRYLGRAKAVGPIQNNKVDARQRDPVAAPYWGQRPDLQLRTAQLEEQEQTSRPRGEELAQPQSRDEECLTEVVATITRGHAKGMTRSAWKLNLEIGLELFLASLILGRQRLQPLTFRRGYHPPSERVNHCHLLLSDLGGIQGLNQLLDKRKLGRGIHLDEIGGWPLRAQGRTADGSRNIPHGLKGGGVRSPVDRLPDCRGADVQFLLPLHEKEPTLRSHQAGPQSVGACEQRIASPLPAGAQRRLPLASEWRPWSRRPSTLPALALHKIKGKPAPNKKLTSIGTTNILRKILKDQKARRDKEEVVSKKHQFREPIQRLPITGFSFPPLGALHGLNCLSHKLRDGSRLIIHPYIELEVTGHFSFFSRRLHKGGPHRLTLVLVRDTNRKSYFQCFIFDFFLMAVMKPGLLLKQYHPRPPVSLGALWMVCARLNVRGKQHNLRRRQFIYVQNFFNHWVKRKLETIVESCTINIYTFGGRLIHCSICIGDYKGVPGGIASRGSSSLVHERPWSRGSDCLDRPQGPSRLGPLETLVSLPQSRELVLQMNDLFF